MELYRITYLLLDISFLCIWLALFLKNNNKDFRKEMLVMSLIFGLAGPFADMIYIQDWWHPLSITGAKLAYIEASLFGFVIGGVASVIYEAFSKKIRRKNYEKIFGEGAEKRNKQNKLTKVDLKTIFLILLQGGVFVGSFYILKIDSFWATNLSLIIPILIIYFRRKDLIINSLLSGVILTYLAFLIYNFLELLTPGWIKSFWYFQNTPALIILNFPIDDLLWYFLTGAYIAPLYEYWKKERLTELKIDY